jgi:hypothetical protein
MDEAGIGAAYYEYLYSVLGEGNSYKNSILPN